MDLDTLTNLVSVFYQLLLVNLIRVHNWTYLRCWEQRKFPLKALGLIARVVNRLKSPSC
jgi:hypothetical protein